MSEIRLKKQIDGATGTPPADYVSLYKDTTASGIKIKDESGTIYSLTAGVTDHTALTNIGTNTHAQIDSHIANTSNPHSVTKSQVGLGNVDNTSDLDKPISNATQTALNSKVGPFPLKAPTGLLANPPSYGFAGGDDDTGIYSTGDGNVSIQANGFLKASFDQNTINFYAVSGVSVSNDLTVGGNFSAANFPPTGPNNTIAYYNGTGDLDDLPNYSVNTFGAVWSNLTYEPNGGTGGYNIHETYFTLDPLANTPNESQNLYNLNYNIDPNSTGFTLGTAGNLGSILNMGFNHQGTSNIGQAQYIFMNSDIGNGTDPFTMNGFSMVTGFINIDDNVTVSNAIQGYGFQPNMAENSIMNSNIKAFYDNANIQTAVAGYTVIDINSTVEEIKNNNNFTGINLNASVDAFTGNASFTGIGLGGNYGTFSTGVWQGILVNPTVTSVVNATGLFVDMQNITASGTKQAAYFNGDVQITGSLTFGGALSIGQLNAFYSSNTVNGGGNPTTIHGLVTSVTAQAASTITNADMIGVNTAMLINLAAGSTTTSGPFQLGLAALALPCVVETHSGATLDFMNCAGYALSLSGSSTGGTIDTVHLCRTTAIPNGITTINNLKAFKFDLLFGGVATNTWGVYIEPDVNNYMQGNLLIGGTAGSVDTVTNSSVGLEIISTTKAFLNARMTTTQRNALTAVNGMQIYNTTDDKLQVYAAGSWVDLH